MSDTGSHPTPSGPVARERQRLESEAEEVARVEAARMLADPDEIDSLIVDSDERGDIMQRIAGICRAVVTGSQIANRLRFANSLRDMLHRLAYAKALTAARNERGLP